MKKEMQRRSSQLDVTYEVAKRKTEKFRLARIQTLVCAIPLQCSSQLSWKVNWKLVLKLLAIMDY